MNYKIREWYVYLYKKEGFEGGYEIEKDYAMICKFQLHKFQFNFNIINT